jgi:hypothetical protein
MGTALVVAGSAGVVGGLMLVAVAVRLYRAGSPWRAMALNGGASTLYGGIVLAGLTPNGSWVGTTLAGLIAIAVWVSVWLARRERSQAVQSR